MKWKVRGIRCMKRSLQCSKEHAGKVISSWPITSCSHLKRLLIGKGMISNSTVHISYWPISENCCHGAML